MKQTLSISPLIAVAKSDGNVTADGAHTHRKFRHYITDYQGNNTAVVSDSGAILEQTAYFPYGEPFREPSHPYTFSDNERLHAGGQNQYDFHARRLIPTLLRFDCPDPLMEKKPWISPYLYCDGNPIKKIDPLGLTDFVCMETQTTVYIRDGRDIVLEVSEEQLNQLRDVHFDSNAESYMEVLENAIVRYDLFPTVENVLHGKAVVTWGDGHNCYNNAVRQNNATTMGRSKEHNTYIDTYNTKDGSYDVKNGAEYAKSELLKGKSVVAGVKYNSTKKPYNKNPDTRHFINLVGMGFNFINGIPVNFFSYYDSGVSSANSVSNVEENRLYLGVLRNVSCFSDRNNLNVANAKYYILTEIRKNK